MIQKCPESLDLIMDASKTTTKLNLSIRLWVKTVLLIYGCLVQSVSITKVDVPKEKYQRSKGRKNSTAVDLHQFRCPPIFVVLRVLFPVPWRKLIFSIRLRVKTVLLIYGCRIVFRAFRFRTGRASLYSLQIICLDKNLKFSNFTQIAIFTICTSHCLV